MTDLSRLRWRCRRGMRELDLLFDQFLQQGYGALSGVEKDTFELLLDCQDDRLYDWFYQGERPDDPAIAALVERIRSGFQSPD
ncbi:antitoxin CptB [Natronocella acetinitrilica]|uniref:FAD assembly factor SdhE n=1 Tax=Natronocella acetinitrilica TaxID=414046 RepID=A0AAE3G6Z0_9GAMM|nr:succinate dehydrogenase assembly factor 2 [Natronocella acetinitrilica]MCP1675911.1 antitoxin CptB [Natronocella acetinitrilica]